MSAVSNLQSDEHIKTPKKRDKGVTLNVDDHCILLKSRNLFLKDRIGSIMNIVTVT